MAIVVGTAAIAVFGVLILYYGNQGDYSTLFTGLNQEEVQEVVALLQDQGVDYKFNDRDGAIRVSASNVDQTRAKLLSQGYPKSGFTYDMYCDNAGLMSTESDKKQYTLYELQDRLGAQIRLFDGVRDAKVTIAEAGQQKYALGDDRETDASASVVVTMKNGQTLSGNTAAAIKNLIARSVRGMNFTNVAVFDAVTMTEVGGSLGGEDGTASTKDLTALTSLIESNIAGNVRRVLEKLYGQENVAVSVKGTLNMERLIQENVQYSAPDKADDQDRTGLLEKEDVINENSAMTDQKAGGVAGADSNADVPRYTNNNNNNRPAADTYANSSATREWLYDSLKEQRQVDPGVLENTTIGVVINTEDTTVPEADLVSLIANSSGIPKEEADQKITVIRAMAANTSDGPSVPVSTEPSVSKTLPVLPLIIAAAAGCLLLLFLTLLLLNNRKDKRKAAMYEEEEMDFSAMGEDRKAEDFPARPKTEINLAAQAADEEMERNEEILNLRMQHSLKLKQNIGEFVDQNPQIAAKLIQSWLRGEGDKNVGNRRTDNTRNTKQA